MLRNLKSQRLVINCNNRQFNCQLTILPDFKTEQFSNDYISSLCKKYLFKEALRAFDFLQNNTDFRIRPSTYGHLILACSSLRSLKHARNVHSHLTRSIYKPDIILQNHVLNMYGKCGSLEDAQKVFDDMSERNAVSWTSLIAGYSQNHLEKNAIDLYVQMRSLGLFPDQFTFGSVIKACSGLRDLELGKQLHADIIKFESGLDLIGQNALVAMYTRLGLVDDAWTVFDRMVKKDLTSWGSMISGFAQQGFESKSLELFKEMSSIGVHNPNEFVFGSAFSACSGILNLEYGRQLHGMSIKFGLGTDAYAGCSLCDMYAKCGCLDSARTVFNYIEVHDKVSWNAIIAGFAYCGAAGEAMSFFSQMRLSNLMPDEITVRCLLCSFASSSSYQQGKQVHSYIFKTGFISHVSVCNTLLTMYTKCSDLSDVFKIFKEMESNLDLVSWNAMLTACLQHNHENYAFGLLKQMHGSQHKPDQVTLTNVLSACAVLASLENGYQVHCYAIKSGLKLEVSVMNGLIDMYTKCGILINAQKLFESMRNPDVVSWSSLIVGYAQFGYGDKAIELFQTMRHQGINPNHVTFVGVLSACSRVGLVEEGSQYYIMMETEYGMSPTREHCSCMVDLLARAGRLTEAVSFINEMPFDPDIVIWKTLLAACKIYKNLEIGKLAAENVLKLDPSNSAAHVLLCNIYASNGRWDDVARVRKLMKNRGIRKVPGRSWIETKDGVHVFSVEDKSHQKMDEIYMVLGDLCLEMMEAGYVPDQRFELVPD